MPQYKLTYFDLKGLGEPIRYLLSYLGENFEDNRFPREQWPAMKPKTPFGKVPILEVDGKPLTQSTAIARWLGKKANLAGKNDWEALQIDIVVDTFTDMRMAIAQTWMEQNPEEKTKKMDVLMKETIPGYLSKFDKTVKESGYLANGSLSWADLYLCAVMETMSFMINGNILEKYPNLTALKQKVEELPKIKAWIAKRPKTDL